MNNALIIGNGGREAAIGTRMAESSRLFAFMGHANPTLVSLCESTGGSWALGDVCDAASVSAFAQERKIEIAMVSSDNPLESGVVDSLRARGIATVGPTRSGAQIEWDKAFSRRVVDLVAPQANPLYSIVTSESEIDIAIRGFGDRPVVIKPTGLAGGKGVKVVGPHLADNNQARCYAQEILASGNHEGVVIEERLDYPEFTIQAMTDGANSVFPPPTYDYPYRYDGDIGPGTGGMGSFVLPGLLPFVPERTYKQACTIISLVLEYLAGQGRDFSGCMNAGFFATPDGPMVIEFNARFGDPEAMNIMSILRSDWIETMWSMVNHRLDKINLAPEASVVTYLVSPDYCSSENRQYRFSVDLDRAIKQGVDVWFSSAVSLGDSYVTLGSSRALALAAHAPQLSQAREAVLGAVESSVIGPLEYRREIGDPRYIQSLSNLVG